MGDDEKPEGAVTTPTGEKEQTPETKPTLAPEVEALVSKANAALTNVGRIEAELKRSQSVANAALTRLKEMEEEKYRIQEESAKDDPDELARIRKRRQDDERKAKLEEKETKVNTQFEKLLRVNAKSLSGQYNVSEETLLKYAGDDPDGMEELAKSYGERAKAGETIGKRMTEPPDDGKTKGGGAGLTKEDVKKMSPEEQNKQTKEIASISF